MKASLENRSELLDEVATLLRDLRGAWIALPASARQPAP
jgi:flagellin-specific chaperone FliS